MMKKYQIVLESVESFCFFTTNKEKEVEEIVNELSSKAKSLKVYEKTGKISYSLLYSNNNNKIGFC